MAKVQTTATSTKPTKEKKEKKAKAKRPEFTAKVDQNAEGEYTTVTPQGFSFDSFRPISSKNFASKELALRHAAARLRWNADRLDKKAEDVKNGAGSSKTKRVEKQMDKMLEFIEELKKNGQDTSKFEALVKAAEELKATTSGSEGVAA